MNKSAEKSARLEEVVRRLAVNIELFSQVERYYKMFVNSYRDLVEVLRRLKLLELVDFYKKYKNCSIEEPGFLISRKRSTIIIT